MFTVIVRKSTGFTDTEVQGMRMLAERQRGKLSSIQLNGWRKFAFDDETHAKFFADTMRATGRYSVAQHVAA